MSTMEEFELRPEHIKLLSNSFVGWQSCETGAPAIDPKRPYGNSDVPSDVAEILGAAGKKCPHCGEFLESAETDKLLKLHRETEIALQIVLCTQSFVPGAYTKIDWRTWKAK